MKQYVCSVCGYVYDEEKGIPEAGIAPGTPFSELPPEWKCPVCKADKAAFQPKGGEPKSPASHGLKTEKELSPMETSIICSNLARGCEKQYLPEQAEDFRILADFFRSKAAPAEYAGMDELLELIGQDLSSGYPYGKQTASEKPDRGALRCQVWGEKVTGILKSVLTRYASEGERLLAGTGVYVCTICGFIWVGDNAPEQCPVCKVPAWKFEKTEGRDL